MAISLSGETNVLKGGLSDAVPNSYLCNSASLEAYRSYARHHRRNPQSQISQVDRPLFQRR